MSKQLHQFSYELILAGLFGVAVLSSGCTSEIQALPDQCEGSIRLNSTISSRSTCEQANGSFLINASGGTGDFTYSLNGQKRQLGNAFTDLSAGSYTVKVTDELGCSAEIRVNIPNEAGVNAEIERVNNSSCEEVTGSITVSAKEGQELYEYRLNEANYQLHPTFENLAPRSYVITIRDASGCTVELTADVRSDVLFNEIRDVVQTNCAISGYDSGSTFPDLSADDNIVDQASRIMSETVSRSMPPSSSGKSLSNEEIAAIACWVNDGATLN